MSYTLTIVNVIFRLVARVNLLCRAFLNFINFSLLLFNLLSHFLFLIYSLCRSSYRIFNDSDGTLPLVAYKCITECIRRR